MECHLHPVLLLLLCLFFAGAAGNAGAIADGSEPGDVTLPWPPSAKLPPPSFQSLIRITPPPCEYGELARKSIANVLPAAFRRPHAAGSLSRRPTPPCRVKCNASA
ncbi:hypothetical protein EJB05_05353 [Eragrostis curvula]|uniref:Uncharacterized protein n=1 Tax=Eragrostis curvula TaxID=38414 RepID=A0A5J9WBX0_9POAL|nr:hypothetical protein EJB05_05353 [Eragrostis curvula]